MFSILRRMIFSEIAKLLQNLILFSGGKKIFLSKIKKNKSTESTPIPLFNRVMFFHTPAIIDTLPVSVTTVLKPQRLILYCFY